MLKVSLSVLTLVLACGFASRALAAGPAAVSSDTLSSMGLGSMAPLSDSEGETIRGKGTFAMVWGGSSAIFGTQSAENNYSAGSSWAHKPSMASGSSLSFAGKVNASFAADPTGYALMMNVCGGFAGGGAVAFAH